MNCVKWLFYFYVIYTVRGAAISQKEDTELILVHVIFRHGARTSYLFYPTDPYLNETFYPIGQGSLTNAGKLGQYNFGRYLRKLYGKFLGEDYIEENVYVRSSDVTRTKASALLVLAGLFPPSKSQTWNDELPWQPIPVSYKPDAQEDIFHPWKSCPYKTEVLAHQPELKEVQEIYIKPNEEIYAYIQEKSGKNISHPANMQDFYMILKSEKDMGLVLPEWTKNIYPEPSQTLAAQAYSYHNFNPRVRQINSGYMLKKILNDSKEKIEGKLKRKIYLYSGHESTLGYMLDALKVYKPHVPPYGSAICFEIHRRYDQYYIKMRYINGTMKEPIDLNIPGCSVLCPFNEFVNLQKDLIPIVTVKEACKLDNNTSTNEFSIPDLPDKGPLSPSPLFLSES